MFSYYFWIGFLVFIVFALAIDLGVAHKKARVLTFKDSSKMVGLWFLLAMMFCGFIFTYAGKTKALEFLTGYVVEFSLSMDNVFVFVLIFKYFKIPPQFQHRVLFWGILGAIIMRFIMITGGIFLFEKFEWIFLIFGIILIYSGYKIAFSHELSSETGMQANGIMKFLGRYFNVTKELHGEKFFAIEKTGRRVITPLFVVLLFIEKTDLIFALDSIPAIIAITKDPFIIFTSNIFAIIGLRSLYFMLANMIERFAYLKYGLAIILVFVGFKMIFGMYDMHLPISLSLLFIVLALGISVIYSFAKTRKL